MKYDGIVIFTDLDGTLLNEDSQPSAGNIEAINDFINQGGRFGVATGRAGWTVRKTFPMLNLNMPSIFFNGALVFDIQTGEEIHSAFLPEGLAPIFQDILDRYPYSSVEVNAAGKAYVLRFNAIVENQLALESIPTIKANWQNIPNDWYKVVIADRRENLKKIIEYLDGLKRTDIKVVFSGETIVDVFSSEVSKGSALLRQKKTNIDSWKMVFSVGDNDNDLELIRAADVGIAVGNARPCIKEVAKHIIAHHSIPCIPQVLKIIDTYL